MASKRDFDAQLRALREPTPMSVTQALAAENPVHEISIRLSSKGYASMSDPEKVFWAVSYFLGDSMNGGLEQAMSNDTGELTPVFEEFVKRYGSQDLRELTAELMALFPDGTVPMDRAKRSDWALSRRAELDQLTTRLYQCESLVAEGLLSMVEKNQHLFDLSPSATKSRRVDKADP